MSDQIQSVLKEARVFPPPAGVQPRGARVERRPARRAAARRRARPGGVLGRHRQGAALVHALAAGARVEPAVRQVVRRRHDQPLLQLPRPAPRHLAAQQGGDHLGGRAGRQPRPHLPDLHREVCRFANVLQAASASKPGDRVGIYMPMIPELAIAMLACARIGATHTVVFGGFSAEALRDRHQRRAGQGRDHRRRRLPPRRRRAAQGQRRRGAAPGARRSRRVVVVSRTGQTVPMNDGRDLWWHELMDEASDVGARAEPLDAEHPLFILYTSGTTGKPKGVVHTTGGYLVHTYITSKWVFDLKDDDTYWCTADIGWVTGHSYVVYGLLANGATTVMYEGAPNYPEPDRFWHIIEKYGVTIFYTAPTAIRSFMKWGDRVAAQASTRPPAPARHGRRADQSRSLDVVSARDRRASAARSSTPGGRPRPAAS